MSVESKSRRLRCRSRLLSTARARSVVESAPGCATGTSYRSRIMPTTPARRPRRRRGGSASGSAANAASSTLAHSCAETDAREDRRPEAGGQGPGRSTDQADAPRRGASAWSPRRGSSPALLRGRASPVVPVAPDAWSRWPRAHLATDRERSHFRGPVRPLRELPSSRDRHLSCFPGRTPHHGIRGAGRPKSLTRADDRSTQRPLAREVRGRVLETIGIPEEGSSIFLFSLFGISSFTTGIGRDESTRGQ